MRPHVAEGAWQGRTGQSTAQSGRQAPAANLYSPVLPYLGLGPLKGGLWDNNYDTYRSQHLPRPWYQVLAHQALCQHLPHG